MKWFCSLVVGIAILTSTVPFASADSEMNEVVLRAALGHAACQAIEANYHEDRSWYPMRFKILSIEEAKRIGATRCLHSAGVLGVSPR